MNLDSDLKTNIKLIQYLLFQEENNGEEVADDSQITQEKSTDSELKLIMGGNIK